MLAPPDASPPFALPPFPALPLVFAVLLAILMPVLIARLAAVLGVCSSLEGAKHHSDTHVNVDRGAWKH